MAASLTRPFGPALRVRHRPGLSETQKKAVTGARKVAEIMDNRFSVFGFRFGVDAIVGIIPGVGDVVSAIASVYLLGTAVQLGLSPLKLAQMVTITVIDLLLGLVPFLGDAADAVFKSHMRNLRIIEAHVAKLEHRATRP